MHFGPSLNLSPDVLAALGAKLAIVFGTPITVSDVHPVLGNANEKWHFAATVAVETYIGLKAAERGILHGTRKELVYASVATLIGMPNVCRAEETTVDEIPALKGKVVVATEWFRGSVGLDDKTAAPTLKQAFKNDLYSVLKQIGQQMALGVLLGQTDCNDGNWLGRIVDAQLISIDHETCLDCANVAPFRSVLDYVVGDDGRREIRNAGPAQGNGSALAEGLKSTWFAFMSNVDEIRRRVHVINPNFKIPPIEARNADEFVEIIFKDIA